MVEIMFEIPNTENMGTRNVRVVTFSLYWYRIVKFLFVAPWNFFLLKKYRKIDKAVKAQKRITEEENKVRTTSGLV